MLNFDLQKNTNEILNNEYAEYNKILKDQGITLSDPDGTTFPELINVAKQKLIETALEKNEKNAFIVYLKKTREAIGFATMRECEPGVYEEMGIAIGPAYVRRGYGKQILNALCTEAKKQGAKEFKASYREKNLASKGLLTSCGFEFDFKSEEKTDPRTGEKYFVINCKKLL